MAEVVRLRLVADRMVAEQEEQLRDLRSSAASTRDKSARLMSAEAEAEGVALGIEKRGLAEVRVMLERLHAGDPGELGAHALFTGGGIGQDALDQASRSKPDLANVRR
jgi:hypothetical protein